MEDCLLDLAEGLHALITSMDQHLSIIEVMLYPLLLALSHTDFRELAESGHAGSASFKTVVCSPVLIGFNLNFFGLA